MNFSELLLNACEQRGWKPAELARRVGVARAQVWNWLSGTYCPRQRHLRSIAEIIEVPYETLVEAVTEQRYRS